MESCLAHDPGLPCAIRNGDGRQVRGRAASMANRRRQPDSMFVFSRQHSGCSSLHGQRLRCGLCGSRREAPGRARTPTARRERRAVAQPVPAPLDGPGSAAVFCVLPPSGGSEGLLWVRSRPVRNAMVLENFAPTAPAPSQPAPARPHARRPGRWSSRSYPHDRRIRRAAHRWRRMPFPPARDGRRSRDPRR
jgi:hypothetical protein